MVKYHNTDYSGGFPLAVGDRYHSQDLFRDFWHLKQVLGDNLGNSIVGSGVTPTVLSGCIPSAGVGHTVNITAGRILVPYNVTVPNSWAADPPTTTTDDVMIAVDITAQTNLALTGTTDDGATPNYLKIAYAESGGSSRSRAKKAGSYNSEITPSFTITSTSVVATAYEVNILQFLTAGAGITAFSDYEYATRRNSPRSATMILASSDSNTYSQTCADFVIPTSSDSGIIISAICDDLTTNGGTIQLMEGTYNCSSPINIESNIILEGMGYGTELKKNANVSVIDTNAETNIKILNLRINGNDATYTGYGIEIGAGSRVEVKKCYIHNSSTSGIYITGDDELISNNSIYDCGIGISIVSTNTIRVLGNEITNMTTDGIKSSNSHKSMYSNNIISDCGSNGINVGNTDSYLTLSGNICENNTAVGIKLTQVTYTTIIGNVCTSSARGVYLLSGSLNNQITGNILFNNSTVAAQLDSGANSNVFLTNRTVSGGGAADVTNAGAGNSIQGNY